MPSGAFIVLEGIDGSGTTTQCQEVARRLRETGHEVLATREPSDGRFGRMVRAMLSERDPAPWSEALALAFATDRLEHLRTEIEPALAAGRTVVCDRYVASSWAYQGLTLDHRWVEQINRRARWPDLTLVLEVPAELAVERVLARRARAPEPAERFDALEVQRRVAQAYARVVERGRAGTLRGVVAIDGTQSLEAVTGEIMAAIGAHIA